MTFSNSTITFLTWRGLLYPHMTNSSENHSNQWTWWASNFWTINLINSNSFATMFHPTWSISNSTRMRSFPTASSWNTFLMRAITWLRLITKIAQWDKCWSSMICSWSHPPSEKNRKLKKKLPPWLYLKRFLPSKERRWENSKSTLLLKLQSCRRSKRN